MNDPKLQLEGKCFFSNWIKGEKKGKACNKGKNKVKIAKRGKKRKGGNNII